MLGPCPFRHTLYPALRLFAGLSMKKIEAIIRPLRLEIVKSALAEAGVTGMTVSDVRGTGRGGGHAPGTFRGEEYIIRMPAKIKIELAVRDDEVDEVVMLIREMAHTGEEGDGWIFVLAAGEARRDSHRRERR